MTQDLETLSLYFVLCENYQSEEDVASAMREAFQSAVGWGLRAQWIKESCCVQADRHIKGQIFIFENFSGDTFSRFIKSHTNRVIGPECLLECISKNIPIPKTSYPVFNMAMGGLIICASNVPIDQKEEMKKLVCYMGGNFFTPLITSTTHLVVNSILSDKYFKACEEGIKIMKKSWIEDVWKRNLISNIKATDENIIREYKVPIFYNLKVTASGLPEAEKNKIKKAINDNGGTYTQEMPKGTDVLILPIGKGEKFKYAERWKIKCIKPLWIESCLEKGYAVRYQDYIVQSGEKKCSTPMNACNKMVSLMNANDSDISVIPSGSSRNVVCDTQMDSPSIIRNNVFKTPVKSIPKNECSPKTDDSKNHRTMLDDIALTDVKKCGPLLDGCKVYLAGFRDNEEEKLRRILNYGGAMRFTELNDSVTHVIVGNPCKNDLNNIKMAHHTSHIVSVDWLLNSIKKGYLEKESNCLYFTENKEDEPQTSKVLQQPSPLSKKGLQMLNSTRNVSANPEPRTEIDHNLIEKYSHSLNEIPCAAQPKANKSNDFNGEESSNEKTVQSSTNDKLFAGFTFGIIGHEKSAEDDIKRTILDFGGIVSKDHRRVDYTIVPVTNVFQDSRFAEAVTSVWMEECLNENRIIEIKYYHRPLVVSKFSNSKSSCHCVITFSSYNIYERQYLEKVAGFLGTRCQDVLSRKVDSDRNIARTTHLVCASAQGAKYNAARKWNLPIVTEKWLLDSFSQRELLPLDSYLLQEDEDNQSEGRKNYAQNNEVPPTRASERTTSFAENQSEEKKQDAQSSGVSSARPSGKEKSTALRSSYPVPTLVEAFGNTSDKICMNQSKRLEITETKELPHGLLAQINRETSSTIKRKLDDETSNFEAARIGSPKRKLLRPDAANVTSSYEEVGWQDTLTDIQLDNCSDMNNRTDNRGVEKASSKDSEKESGKTTPLDVNNMESCNADLRHRNDAEKVCKRTTMTDSSSDVNILGVYNHDKKNENQSAKERFQISRERTNQLFRNNAYRTHWNMMISINEKEKKQKCETTITVLGGRVVARFDPDCLEHERVTHLIIDELKKTEKLLCSIANGLWVLHSSYLTCCEESGKFVTEEQFEWGNPLNKNLPTKESSDYASIAKAAHRWRKLIQTEGPSKRPFVGMRAVIVSSGKDDSMQSLIRVVKSGGGTLIQRNDILKATHCFVTTVKNLDNLPVPMRELAAKKIHCLPAVYLSDYLMTDPPPKPEACYFDVYKRFF